MAEEEKEDSGASSSRANAVQHARVSLNMSAREAYEFALGLATDDELRERLEEHPYETLAQFHIYAPPGTLPDPVRLPGKDELRAALTDISLGGEFRPVASDWVWIAWFAFFAFAQARVEQSPERKS
jgi:hypothetical protein